MSEHKLFLTEESIKFGVTTESFLFFTFKRYRTLSLLTIVLILVEQNWDHYSKVVQ